MQTCRVQHCSTPVGKSGAGMCCMSCALLMSGCSTSARRAATTSCTLCGGIFVAIPTAMPCVPLISRCGTLAGSTSGSSCSANMRLELSLALPMLPNCVEFAHFHRRFFGAIRS